MDPKHKLILRKNHGLLKSDLNIDSVRTYLFESEILTLEDSEELLLITKTDTQKREHFLIKILPNRGPEAYQRFIEALEQDDHDDYIVRMLKSTVVTQDEIFKYIGTSFSYFLSDLHHVTWCPS